MKLKDMSTFSSARPLQRAGAVLAAFGEWDTPNLGDRSILEGIRQLTRGTVWEVLPVGLGSLKPSTGSPYLPSPEAGRRAKRSALDPVVAHVKDIARPFWKQYRAKQLAKPLAPVDAILVGGGALLSGPSLRFAQSLSIVRKIASRLQVPLICLGCSSEDDPVGEVGESIREFVLACDFIAVRDSTSAAKLKALTGREIPIFGDFAWQLDRPVSSNRSPHSSYHLAINVACFGGPYAIHQQDYCSILLATARTWLSRSADHRVTIFTTGLPEDGLQARLVHEGLADNRASLVLPTSTAALRTAIGACACSISGRLHSAILAFDMGVPSLGVSPSRKLARFFESVGIGEDVICTSENATVEAVARRLFSAELLSQRSQMRVDDMRAVQLKSLEFLNRVVTRGVRASTRILANSIKADAK